MSAGPIRLMGPTRVQLTRAINDGIIDRATEEMQNSAKRGWSRTRKSLHFSYLVYAFIF